MAPRRGLPTASVTGGSSLKCKKEIIVTRNNPSTALVAATQASLATVQAAKSAWNAVRTNAHATAAQKKAALESYKAAARAHVRKRLG